jgi:CRP-like cAMP-binding protein
VLAVSLPEAPLPVSGNRLLDAFFGTNAVAVRPDLEIVTLPARTWLAPYAGPRHHVDFPIDAVISVVATLRSGDAVEVGSVGREGFVETDAALESDAARRGWFCQIAGDVVRMPLAAFRERMERDSAFARFMHRNAAATLFTAQQYAACNARHDVKERTARWLLATRRRVQRDGFALTHESLAMLLGVRRATVTDALGALQDAGAIEQRRGRVTVSDERALRAAACECDEECEDAYRQSLA